MQGPCSERLKNIKRKLAKILLSVSIVVFISHSGYSQCSVYVQNGNTNPCIGTPETYQLVSTSTPGSGQGAATCTSIAAVFGPSTQSFSGNTVNWNGTPGSYTIRYNCSCGQLDFPTPIILKAKAQVFNVTGGGGCPPSGSYPVNLSGSQSGVTYNLY